MEAGSSRAPGGAGGPLGRRRLAIQLAALVAVAGVLPVMAVGGIAIEVLRRRAERAAGDRLQQVASQAAGRIEALVGGDRQMLRALAALPPQVDVPRALDRSTLRELGVVELRLVGPVHGAEEVPAGLGEAEIAAAQGGREVASSVHPSRGALVVDRCVPAKGRPGSALCARFQLEELALLVRRIRVGTSGYALAFDGTGLLVGSGAAGGPAPPRGPAPEPEREMLDRARSDPSSAPRRFRGARGGEVLAAWAFLPDGWALVVEQPVAEALRPARIAQGMLGACAFAGLLLAVGVGYRQSQRVLAALEGEERWRTAGRLAVGITHDLGHRVAILEHLAELAAERREGGPPALPEHLRSEAEALRSFVAEFADLARDPSAMALAPLELGAFAESVARSAAVRAGGLGVALDVERPGAEAWTRADRHLLERAALNLLTNALEATPRGGRVRLAVSAREREVELVVEDRGTGIEPGRLARVFEPFGSTKRGSGHLGLGLANVKRIVEAHGGTVHAESAAGAGTVFRLRLPRAPPAAQAAARG